MLVSKLLEDVGHSSATITILIPDMNFTCCAKLVGFTFGGINRRNRDQDPKIQMWRKDISEPGVYHKTGNEISVDISENGPVLMAYLQYLAEHTFVFWLNVFKY